MPPRFSLPALLLALGLALVAHPGQAQRVIVPATNSGTQTGGPSGESGQFLGDLGAPPQEVSATPGKPGEAVAATTSAPATGAAWPPAAREPVSADGCSRPLTGSGTTYHVGPGQAITELTDVPWLSLRAGDVVNIHHRAEPYRTKFALRAQGTADAPVVIHGVTDAKCNRPVISGQNAVTARDAVAMGYFNKQYTEPYGLIFIYKSREQAWGSRPKHIRIENLKLTGAHKDSRYTAQDGSIGQYLGGAAAVYAVVVEDLTIENCEITRNGNGVFVNSKSEDEASRNVFIRHNRIWENGNTGSWFEHNLYVQTARALYEGNSIGQLIPGAKGSSMKDRSSATVVRFNHIVAAARAIDLVEIEGGVRQILKDPLYPDAWVYGNLIVNDFKNPGLPSVKLIHWGGDNDERYFRQGTLHFYNNTVLHSSTQAQAWYMALFDMPTAQQKVDAQSNLFVNQGTTQMRVGHEGGTIEFNGNNWISRDWAEAAPTSVVKVAVKGKLLTQPAAGLGPDGRPRAGAAGTDLADNAADLPPVGYQFAEPAGIVRRVQSGRAMDLGAFELK
ncbi:MAG: hypothetical protein RLZZ373_643 [Pseudomonadota bacterium]